MSKARILAVDDQRYFRELTEGLLGDAGYDVQTATSGEEALHLLERDDFDIILTDLVMPGIDGSELVRRIKERRPEQDVIMVTGVVDVKTAVDAMKQGAVDYILKPFDRDALVDSVDRILKQRRLRDEHARLMEENLEFMGVLSLFERAAGLFATLAVDPLAERLIEGLCFETRAQTGVLWVADRFGGKTLRLIGARGLVRVDGEPETVELEDFVSAWCPGLGEGRSIVAALPEDAHGREALYVPIRAGDVTIGIARLADKLDDEAFSDSDRAMAEKFGEFGAIALHNAMRFRALERRSLRDPVTRAYTRAFFEDAVRNEIQKSQRFAHRFSILRIEAMPPESGADRDPVVEGWHGDDDRREIARRITGALRSSDLLAESEDGAYLVLLPQTDALGAGILAQRVRTALASSFEGGAGRVVRCVAATHPVDGSQLEALLRTLEHRMAASRSSLLDAHPEFQRCPNPDALMDRLLELATPETIDAEGQILRFVLEDVIRRPGDRGILILSPGARWLPDVLETLYEIRDRNSQTEIVLLAEVPGQATHPKLTCIAKSSLDARRPFLVYFGEGPAYAMVGSAAAPSTKSSIFQTGDRDLVQHLAFELQRELGILISVQGSD